MTCLHMHATESTLKRHGYYCRSQKGMSTRKVRGRSCAACVKAKARCNNELPRCERCVLKNLECRVRGGRASRFACSMRDSASDIGDASPETPSASDEAIVPFTPISDASSLIPNTGTGFEVTDFNEGWDMIHLDSPSTFHATLPTPQSQTIAFTNPQAISTPQHLFDVSTSIPSMPSYALRSFTKRSSSASTTTTLILRILTSYPTMLADPTSPPPFIHPSFLTGADDMESLSTCASLMHLLSSPRNQSLLWKNVRLECERLQVQVRPPSFHFPRHICERDANDDVECSGPILTPTNSSPPCKRSSYTCSCASSRAKHHTMISTCCCWARCGYVIPHTPPYPFSI
jgi:hypothetical protein